MNVTPLSLEQAMQMIADALNEPLGNIDCETQRASIVGWDSMGALMLIAELDDRFGIELSADDSRKMNSIDDILAVLRAHYVLQE